jgi:DNA-binding PadR family transcriptional regulator
MALLKGTLDVLVLKALTWGPRHGHAVARMIQSASGGAFTVLDGRPSATA